MVEEVITSLLEVASQKIPNPKERDGIIWGIITALRGPDTDNKRLKELTTARIRSIINIEHHGLVCRKEPLTVAEQRERDRLLDSASVHFKFHYNDACTAICLLYKYNLLTEQSTEDSQ